MLLNIFLVVAGFAFLVKGADWLVSGASSLARTFGVPDLVVGLTIVAFGTSTPELVVSVLAAAREDAAVSLGNVVGSNICNILLILGVASVLFPLSAAPSTVWKEIPFMLLASVLLVVQASDRLISGASADAVSRSEGIVLLLVFCVFLVYIFEVMRGGRDEVESDAPAEERSTARSVLMLLAGLAGLVAGGHLVVTGAVSLATAFGVSEAMIGLTIVAIGTSLPELAASVVAAYKKNAAIAVGNVVGSNIFNIFFVLGTTAAISPVPVAESFGIDFIVMLAAAFALLGAMLIGRVRHAVERFEGMVFLAAFVGYMIFTVMRG